MQWTDFFIKRPVFSISIMLIIMALGILGYSKLDIRLFPIIESAVININIEYSNASADTIKTNVVNRISDRLNHLNNLDYIRAESKKGQGNIEVHFYVGTKMDVAYAEVNEAVNSVREILPKNIESITVKRVDLDENPDWLLAFSTTHLDTASLADFLSHEIKPQLEAISGVARVQIMSPQLAMRVALDPDRMAAFGVSVENVLTAFHTQNRFESAGKLEGSMIQFPLNLNLNVNTMDQFDRIIVKSRGDELLHLSDIATVKWGAETDNIRSFYREKPSVQMLVKISPSSNPMRVIHKLQKKLPFIEAHLPIGVHAHELVNSAAYMKGALVEMSSALLLSILILILILQVFLKDIRSAIIVCLTIPISMLGAGFFMWVFGCSINVLTLLAFILAQGLVVDDAIVVLENIVRHGEKETSIFTASILATREIAWPVLVMTLSVAALFLPLVFLGGIIGRLFIEFALTLVMSMLISGLVALVLVPMLCRHLLINRERYSFKTAYQPFLKVVFMHKNLIIIAWIFLSIVGLVGYTVSPKELAPKEDVGFLEVLAKAPNSSNTAYLLNKAKSLNTIYAHFPEIKNYSYIVGVPSEHELLSIIRLHSWSERGRKSVELRSLLQKQLNQIPGIQAIAIAPEVMPGMQGMPIEFVVTSLGSYRGLYEVSQKIEERTRDSGLFLYVGDDLEYDQPSYELKINREAAALLNVEPDAVENAITTFLGDSPTQYFMNKGRVYPLIIQGNKNIRQNPDFLNDIYVPNQKEMLIPLGSFMNSTKTVFPVKLNQFQKMNSVTISAIMRPSHSLSQGISYFIQNAKLPITMHYDFGGNARRYLQEGAKLQWLFLSAFLAIFIFLSMQFNSFVDPLIILLGSIPLAIFSAIIPLRLAGLTINLYSQISLLVLFGLISKHGILITQFANELIKNGYDKRSAITMASEIRLRPILMTTMTMVLGAIPLFVYHGPGFQARLSLGLIIVFGMSVGTCLNLCVLPVIYDVFHRSRGGL
jgi:multidrug efflux pump